MLDGMMSGPGESSFELQEEQKAVGPMHSCACGYPLVCDALRTWQRGLEAMTGSWDLLRAACFS